MYIQCHEPQGSILTKNFSPIFTGVVDNMLSLYLIVCQRWQKYPWMLDDDYPIRHVRYIVTYCPQQKNVLDLSSASSDRDAVEPTRVVSVAWVVLAVLPMKSGVSSCSWPYSSCDGKRERVWPDGEWGLVCGSCILLVSSYSMYMMYSATIQDRKTSQWQLFDGQQSSDQILYKELAYVVSPKQIHCLIRNQPPLNLLKYIIGKTSTVC